MNAIGIVAENGDALTVEREADGGIVLAAYNERSGATIHLRFPAKEIAHLLLVCGDEPAPARLPDAKGFGEIAPARGLFGWPRRRALAIH